MIFASTVDVGALFLKLLANYFQFGWPFFFLHVGVLLLSIWTWWGLRREIGHLKRWNPGSSPLGSQSTLILDQFIVESRDLGHRGFLVPITDFSDRLDSLVDGKVTELYERINLFLIVGIAGTLFGVFEFADGAASILGKDASPERVVQLGTILSSSLAKAFPVGFVGLALMFFGQVCVSFSENRLKNVVAEATRRALAERAGDVHSQGQIVADAADRIQSALRPLESLQETMAEHLAPVVAKLGERLDESLGLVRTQFNELKETTKLFASAGDALGGRVAALGENIGKLDGVLRRVPDVLENFESTQKVQQEVIQTFQSNLDTSLQASRDAIGALEAAAGAARTLPAQILAATGEALRNVSAEISAASGVMVGELKHRLTADYNHLFQRVEEMVTLLRRTVSETSDELARHLKESATDLFAGVQKQALALEVLVQKSEVNLRASLEASQGTISALSEMSQSAKNLPSEILETSKDALATVVQVVVQASDTMTGDLRDKLNASSEFLFKQAEDEVRVLREHLAEAAKLLLSQLSLKSSELLDGVKGQVEAVQALVDQTTGQLQEINRAAREAAEGLQGLREEAKGILESSFDRMREDSGTRWSEITGKFAAGTQREFSSFLEAVQIGTTEVVNSLKRSAETWNQAAYNAQEMVKGPIVEVFKKIEADLRAAIVEFDSRLAQRYPDVVKDVSAFTQGLQVLLTKAEAIQRGLDRWAVSVEKSQEDVAESQGKMARARERFLESFAEAAPQAASAEIANLIEGKFDDKLNPVRSDLLQIGATLEELRQRKGPLAWIPKRKPPSPGGPPVPPSLLGRARSWWARILRR